MTFALGLIAGTILGAGALVALLLVMGNSPRGYQPLPGACMPPPPMPCIKPARDADFWDVAERLDLEERVAYQFLGVTGEDDS